ncbi:FAD-binding oxidoreductase [Propionibacterium freudenreichii]|uniref:FAD-binding oxidoreductase n=2 Tax=Propionibacterium freudenreichii TaxID=1744 RepID=UPI0005423963|nr:FAD-dependent oxidoreductase [Propionibacterium freudenreichii]MDK9320138.1 FAD-dependent oxidoreductase [Propionibacterium freudenreichii]MDK9344648.1 FAD-dependent oxidoreductase [Propionibacterium freudenreichii]MDK9644119.1 FAD-dependent oxidoreductase [Propionibacterium freudenreichii]WFF33986.1 FAD-dependent oxidoreductase [Propionibacterium freudenreichii]WFF36217.1 FAD-dependent oxidoreductase [Propionibacterium freudenreichii]
MSQQHVAAIPGFRGPITAEDGGAGTDCMQTAVTIRPELTVEPLGSDDVARAIGHAAEQSLPVSVTNTGHGATSLTGGLLIRTHRMSEIRIDQEARTVEIGPGATWGQVTAAAARHGLAPLSGTAGTVGAVGYTLGGGISPLSRAFGYAADHLVDLDLVTPDGRLGRVSAEDDPDLFWAVRGAGAQLGVVTRMTCRLFPIDHVWAGALPVVSDDWAEIADRFVTWSASIPDHMGAFLSLKAFPDMPSLPEVIRGKRTASIYVTSLGTETEAADQVKALGGLVDQSARLAPTQPADLAEVFREPTGPHAFQGDAMATSGINAEALTTHRDELRAKDRPQFVFIHRLGGAMRTAPDGGTPIGNRGADYLARIITGPGPTDDSASIADEQGSLLRSLSIEPSGRVLNFLFGDNQSTAPTQDCYAPDDLSRITSITARVDPNRLHRPGRGRLDGR